MEQKIKNIIENGIVLKSWSRWTGTGYKSQIILFDNKCYQVDFNVYDQHTGFSTSYTEVEDPRVKQKAFFKECLETSQCTGLPVEVVMALGNSNEVFYFSIIMEEIEKLPHKKEELHELSCGIKRRKDSIKRIFSKIVKISSYIEDGICTDNKEEVKNEIIDYFAAKIDSLGQLNSKRISSFITEKLEEIEEI